MVRKCHAPSAPSRPLQGCGWHNHRVAPPVQFRVFKIFSGKHPFLEKDFKKKRKLKEAQDALEQIYKGGNKSRADPASYRGIYLSSALAKLFEGILISRLTKFTETHNTLTENQLGTRPGRQIHDAIYCLLSIIQYILTQKGLPTYVAFCDFSTAFPSIHRGKLLTLLGKENIVERMWKHLRERFQVVKVRVLHPRISKNSSVTILRGVPEGSRLSPTLFGSLWQTSYMNSGKNFLMPLSHIMEASGGSGEFSMLTICV